MKLDPINVVAAQVALDLCSPDDLVDAALTAIEAGYDVPSLYVLAGHKADRLEDLKEIFLRVLAELGMSLPSKHAAVVALSRAIAQDMLSGITDAESGARKIWELTLRVPAERIPELDTFVYAASEWGERPEDYAIFERGLRAAATKLVGH